MSLDLIAKFLTKNQKLNNNKNIIKQWEKTNT